MPALEFISLLQQQIYIYIYMHVFAFSLLSASLRLKVCEGSIFLSLSLEQHRTCLNYASRASCVSRVLLQYPPPPLAA